MCLTPDPTGVIIDAVEDNTGADYAHRHDCPDHSAGVGACNSNRRAHAALKPARARWLGSQMVARPSGKPTRWRYHSGDVWTQKPDN